MLKFNLGMLEGSSKFCLAVAVAATPVCSSYYRDDDGGDRMSMLLFPKGPQLDSVVFKDVKELKKTVCMLTEIRSEILSNLCFCCHSCYTITISNIQLCSRSDSIEACLLSFTPDMHKANRKYRALIPVSAFLQFERPLRWTLL